MKLRFLRLLLAALPFCSAAPALAAPPLWARDAVWYQIMMERFRNGDPANDPTPASLAEAFAVPPGWATTAWGRNWYAPDAWATAAGLSHDDNLALRRCGGDLQGVINQLDYLRDLGINALFLNPINDAPSLHKYDARSYHHVDVNFGPDPAGDRRLIAAETPNDPATWPWTAADRLFLRLIAEAHRRGLRVVLDYSWNHTGTQFWAWQSLVQQQKASPFADWYQVTAFDDPATPANEFAYRGWANLPGLPEIRKVAVGPPRVSGHPYAGQLNAGAKAHVLAVTRRWLAPDGNPANGLDGYRLDVADQVPLDFWREYYSFVKSIKPNAYLVGEIWWETWPTRMMDPAPYVGDAGIFDAVMFYQVYQPARAFFAKNVADSLDAQGLARALQQQWSRLPPATCVAMMNVAASHDSPRLLTCFENPTKYKAGTSPRDNPAYRTGRPTPDTYRRVRLYLLHQFTSVGAPHIWNGDELGMWGSDDPDCRKPLWWPDLRFAPETRQNYQPGPKTYDSVAANPAHLAYYKQLTRLRHREPLLRAGQLEFLTTAGPTLLAYRRFDPRQPKTQIVVLFNLSNRPQTLKLPAAGRWTNALTNRSFVGKEAEVPALAGVVLKI